MEERDSPRRVKKVVVRRVTTPPSPSQHPPSSPQVRRPQRRERPTDRGESRWAAIIRRSRAGGRKVAAAGRLVIDLTVAELRHAHWPQWDQRVAVPVTGAAAGLMSATLGAAATIIVGAVRGVSGGAGLAGLAVVVVLAVTVATLSAQALQRMGSVRGASVAALGTVLVVVLILALFLDAARTAWAFVLLPVLGAVSFLAADQLLARAEHQEDAA